MRVNIFTMALGCFCPPHQLIQSTSEVIKPRRLVFPGEDQSSWFDYFTRTLNQLMWWAEAAKRHSEDVNPHEVIQNFKTAPSERNAP